MEINFLRRQIVDIGAESLPKSLRNFKTVLGLSLIRSERQT